VSSKVFGSKFYAHFLARGFLARRVAQWRDRGNISTTSRAPHTQPWHAGSCISLPSSAAAALRRHFELAFLSLYLKLQTDN
jgi:hypothetical protein